MTDESDDRPQAMCPECGAALPSTDARCPVCSTSRSDETLVSLPVPDSGSEQELIRSALSVEYEIVEELGRGGMAVVYRARERALDRDVAIKVLPLARASDTELVERFQREARLAASLEHPHIVSIYRVGQAGRVSYFCMKYVPGPTLTQIAEGTDRMAPEDVEQILLEVGEALTHAHARGVVHRDVKPDNIMRDQTGRYVVMDFGIAKSLGGAQLTQTGGSIGTPTYMSPEQAKGGDLDGRSDFYALGVVAYRCLVGHPPFSGDDPLAILYAHVHDPVPEPDLDTVDARRVYSVIRRLLAKAPEERTDSSAELEAALRGAGSSAPVDGTNGGRDRIASSSRAASAGQSVVHWLRTRNRRFWASAALGVAVLVGVLGRDAQSARCREAMPDASEGDRELLMDPLGTVVQGAEIDVSYLVCGLDDDEAFVVALTIGPADGGGVAGGVRRFFGGNSDPVRLTWDDRADGFATSRSRAVDPGTLEAGAYRITLEVEDSRGRDADARHDFTIVER